VHSRLVALWLVVLPTWVRAQDLTAPAAPSPEAPVQHPAPAPLQPALPTVEPPLIQPPRAAPQAGPPAPAQEAPVHRHLGLFAHLDFGVTYLRTTGSKSGSAFAGEGAALGFSAAVGWAPNDEWALALEFWDWKALSPAGVGSDTSVELQAIGLNITRYLVPANLFATVVISGTRLAITDATGYVDYGSADIGFGFKVLLGKEWLLNSAFGIGLGAELFFSANRDGGNTLTTLGGGLVFSVTGR
jgi:hypothetical protein